MSISLRNFDGHDWYLTKTTKRNLPHWELKGSSYFITFNVYESLGKPFKEGKLANLMISIILSEDEKMYDLDCFVIMPNHIHMIVKPKFNVSLAQIMKILKGRSAFLLNKELQRKGSFWQSESFDHLIRNLEGYMEKRDYIRDNPVTAKLVKHCCDYPFSSFWGQEI